MWSPSSSCRPCHPHIVPMLSLSSPHHSHIVPIMPCHPHVVPIAPRRFPCGLHGLWSLHVVPIVPVVSTSSPVIPTSSRRSPHHAQPPRYPLYPPPTPLGGWGPRISKNAIRFELIKIILILFEDLKSVETPPPMSGCMDWWVAGWMGGLMGGLMGGARSNH